MTPDQTLETKRLILRPIGPDHLEAYTKFHASHRAVQRGWQKNAVESWRGLARGIGHHALRGFGWLVATERSTGALVGQFGPIRPEGQPENELAWTIWEDKFEGKGFAHEATEATRNFAFNILGWKTAVSYIHPDNHRSIALAERLGAKPDGMWLTPSNKEVVIYRHPAPETTV